MCMQGYMYSCPSGQELGEEARQGSNVFTVWDQSSLLLQISLEIPVTLVCPTLATVMVNK